MTSLVVRPADVGALFQLVGEARELARAGEPPRRHVTVRLGELVGADVSIFGAFRLTGAHTGPTVHECIDVGWANEADRALVYSYVGRFDDPLSKALWRVAAKRKPPLSARRRDLLGDRQWAECPLSRDAHAKVGVDDVMMGLRSLSPSGLFQTFIFKRNQQRPPFSREERDLLQLYLLEGGRADEGIEPLPLPASLSRRHRQVLELLLAGQTEKEASSTLSISTNTLHGYVKELYKKLGVRSRGELFARYNSAATAKLSPTPLEP